MLCVASLAFCDWAFGDDAGDLLENPGAEAQTSADKAQSALKLSYFINNSVLELSDSVPEAWGLFVTGNNAMQWGSSDKEFHSGKRSCFMKFVEPAKKDGKEAAELYEYILLGKSNGYGGELASKVAPKTKYLYSFWAKGDVGRIGVRAFVWNSEDGDKGGRKMIPTSCRGEDVGQLWRQVTGTFETPPDAKRAAVAIQLAGARPGQTLFVDDASLSVCPEAAFRRKAGACPKVAVYRTGSYEKFGAAFVAKALEESGAFKVDVIDTLAPEAIKDYDALVVTTTRELSLKDTYNLNTGIKQLDVARSLLNFVDSGGGLVLGHDCVGYRGVWETKPFFKVCSGNGKADTKKVSICDSAHPLAEGVAKAFEHSYSDHVTLAPGEKASVLAKDESGTPVVVAGELSRGRIVGIGFPMGLCQNERKENVGTPLSKDEARLLVNAVKWSAAKDKYAVPQSLTDMTLMLGLDQASRQKAAAEMQRQKDEMAKYASLPPPKPFDYKGIWLNSYGFGGIPESGLVRIIDNCQKLGFNMCMVQVKHAEFLYDTEAFPNEMASTKIRKSVETLAREIRKRGMRLALEIRPFHDYSKLPKYISVDERSRLDKGCSMEEVLKAKTFDNMWLCPDHPESLKKALTACEEVIKKFHPDELWFDYVRYPPGYIYPCSCDCSLAKRAEFAKAHPEIKPEDLNEAFAKRQLVGFFTEVAKHCRKLDPKIKIGCYTYSTEWTFSYPFDYHTRYVSTRLSADSPLEKVESDTLKNSELVKKLDPGGHYIPLISSYDHKDGERIFTEFKLLSDAYDKMKGEPRMFIYLCYDFLVKDKKTGELYEDVAKAFSKALGGTWEQSRN